MTIKNKFEKVLEKNVGELDQLAQISHLCVDPLADWAQYLRLRISMRFFENLSDLFMEYAKMTRGPVALNHPPLLFL